MILIDKKMPEACCACPCARCMECAVTERRPSFEEWYEEKPGWCPLHELKPHGLIDKARLLNYINDVQFTYAPADGRGNQEEYDFWQRVFEFIEAAPTVIPADHIRDATKMIEAKEDT